MVITVLLTSVGSSIVIVAVGRMLQLVGPHLGHGMDSSLVGVVAIDTAERLLLVYQETLTLSIIICLEIEGRVDRPSAGLLASVLPADSAITVVIIQAILDSIATIRYYQQVWVCSS